MKVALVHDWLTGMRGGEAVLEQFAARFPAAPIYTLFHFPGSVSPALESHRIHTSLLQRIPGVRRHYRRFLPLFPAAIERLRIAEADLVLSSSHCVAKGVRKPGGAIHVCYCHTPVRYAWDQRTAYFPDSSGPVGALRERLLDRLQSWDARTADRVDHYIANSSFVADRIRRYYGRQAEVVHPPVDVRFFTPGDEPRDGFALMVAALAPYKRVEVAIEACRIAGRPLRIVGDGPERERLAAAAEGQDVRFLGRVDREELRRLYRTAAVFVQPGVEDFGISVVEALACGCPVAALGIGGVLDIVREDNHGSLSTTEGDATQLAAAIDNAAGIGSNLLDRVERAREFSAERFLDRIDRLLSRYLEGASE